MHQEVIEIAVSSRAYLDGVSCEVGSLYRIRLPGFPGKVQAVDLTIDGRERHTGVHGGKTLDVNGTYWMVREIRKPLFGKGRVIFSRMGKKV